MTTFLLVHGAWHGGWCWRKVRPLLEAEGHDIFTPTLTGLGEQSHLLTRDVNLTTHVQDVISLLESEDLSDVVLAGYSYGGLVVTAAVQRVRDRLSHVAYLDALLPADGERGIGLDNDSPLRRSAIERGDGWKIPVPPVVGGSLMGVEDPIDIRWMKERLTAHPLATFEELILLEPGNSYPIPGSYALCTGRGRANSGFVAHAERARQLGWQITEIPTGHDLMISEPKATAEFLLCAVR